MITLVACKNNYNKLYIILQTKSPEMYVFNVYDTPLLFSEITACLLLFIKLIIEVLHLYRCVCKERITSELSFKLTSRREH